MKVKKLYIIRLSCNKPIDDEINGGGNGLYQKYVARMKGLPLALIDITGTAPDIVVKEGSRPAKDDTETDVGVYIFAHGEALKCGGLSAESLAKLLKETLGFTAIRKLCLVSCNMAKSVNPGVKGYLENLCHLLHDSGLNPMIAGYDGFVSLAYEGMEKHAPHKTKGTKYEIDKDMAGKKIMMGLKEAHGNRAARPVFVRDLNQDKTPAEQTKELHKKRFVWQYVDDEPRLIAEGWSDKT